MDCQAGVFILENDVSIDGWGNMRKEWEKMILCLQGFDAKRKDSNNKDNSKVIGMYTKGQKKQNAREE